MGELPGGIKSCAIARALQVEIRHIFFVSRTSVFYRDGYVRAMR
jgi:hypothetical protein